MFVRMDAQGPKTLNFYMSFPVRVYPTIYNHIQPYPTIFSHIQSYPPIYSYIQPYSAISSYIPPYPSISSHIQPYLAISSYIQQYLAISSNPPTFGRACQTPWGGFMIPPPYPPHGPPAGRSSKSFMFTSRLP